MNFFITSIILNIKKIFNKKIVLLSFFVLPLCIFLLVRLNHTFPTLSIGVYFQENDEFSSNIFSFLVEKSHDNPFVSFIYFRDIDQLENAVYTNYINHGYVLDTSLSTNPFSENYINLLTSPRTLAVPIVNEIVASALLYNSLQNITVGIINTHFPEEDVLEFVTESIEFYRQQNIFMEPTLVAVHGDNPVEEISSITLVRIKHGIIGLVILTLLIFITPIFISEKNNGVLLPLNFYRMKTFYYLSIWTSIFLVLTFLGSISTIFLPFYINNFIFLFIYVAKNVIIMAIIYIFMKTDIILQNFGIFIIILNIFFGGVLIDLNEINETLGTIQNFFPLFHYIQSAIV